MPNIQDPPPDNELIIGLVSAVGVPLEEVASELKEQLGDFAYRGIDLHLTSAFPAFDWSTELVEAPYDERVWSYMGAGDELRDRWDRNDAVALLAINQIGLARETITGSREIPAARVAYILRSFKRPEEVALLRAVYGSRFLLLGVTATEERRTKHLNKRIRESRIPPFGRSPVYPPEKLIERDERDEDVPFGQNVRDTFHRADCFVEVGERLSSQLIRIFRIFFQDPTRSPTKDEFGMFQAVAAARRSADLGRQVGASICTAGGDVVSLGANEVPKPGGGLYWVNDMNDSRDVALGEDSNLIQRKRLASDIARRLSELLKDEAPSDEVLKLIEASALGDTLEFVRAVHAEMAALMDAARRGVNVDGCTLFATTFPCHHCARHLVAAGIHRVVYIAPYAKSRAEELHGDAIVLNADPQADIDASDQRFRVPFHPFVGIGPRRYLDWFESADRKTPDGKVVAFDPASAEAMISDRDTPELRSDRLPYLDREGRATALIGELEKDRDFAMSRDD